MEASKRSVGIPGIRLQVAFGCRYSRGGSRRITTKVLAILDGGPGDGEQDVVDSRTVHLVVKVGDGSCHLYERVHTERLMPDGRRAVIFRWRGR